MLNNLVNFTFIIDKFYKSLTVLNKKALKQFDIRRFEIQFYDKSQPINIENFDIEIRWRKPDFKVADVLGVDNDIFISGNTVIFKTTKEMTGIPGNAKMEIILKNDELSDSSWNIDIFINPSIYVENEIASANTSNLLYGLNEANNKAKEYIKSNKGVYELGDKVAKNAEEINANSKSIREVKENLTNFINGEQTQNSIKQKVVEYCQEHSIENYNDTEVKRSINDTVNSIDSHAYKKLSSENLTKITPLYPSLIHVKANSGSKVTINGINFLGLKNKSEELQNRMYYSVVNGEIHLNGTCAEHNTIVLECNTVILRPWYTYTILLRLKSGTITTEYMTLETNPSTSKGEFSGNQILFTICPSHTIELSKLILFLNKNTICNNAIFTIQINLGSSALQYEKYNGMVFDYTEEIKAKALEGRNYISSSNDYLEVKYDADINARLEEKRRFVIPEKIPCVVGHTLNFFYDNVLYAGNLRTLENADIRGVTDIENRTLYRDRWEWTPAAGESRQERYMRGFCYNNIDWTFASRFFSTPVPSDAGSGLTKKILLIGDSITDNNKYQSTLLNLFENDSMNIQLIGTRGYAPNWHEGRSGWSAGDYCTKSAVGSVTNAFWNPSKSKFDFSYYMSQQGYTSVDYVFINLGTNDMKNSNLETLDHFAEIANSIKNYNANIKVIVWLAPPLCSIYDTIEYKNKRIELAENLIKEYDNQNKGYFVAPVVLNIDPNDFATEELPADNRHSKSRIRVVDNTHPLQTGYNKIADVLYYMIKYIATL